MDGIFTCLLQEALGGKIGTEKVTTVLRRFGLRACPKYKLQEFINTHKTEISTILENEVTHAWRPADEVLKQAATSIDVAGKFQVNTYRPGDVDVLVSGDRGGGSLKLALSILNVEHPQSPSNLHLIDISVCEEKYEELKGAFQRIHAALKQVPTLEIGGSPKRVRVLLGGDYKFVRCVLGHQAAAATHFCAWCHCPGKFKSTAPNGLEELLQNQTWRREVTKLLKKDQGVVRWKTRCLQNETIGQYSVAHENLCPLAEAPVVPSLHIGITTMRKLVKFLGVAAGYEYNAIVTLLKCEYKIEITAYHGGAWTGRAANQFMAVAASVVRSLLPEQNEQQVKFIQLFEKFNNLWKTIKDVKLMSPDEADRLEEDCHVFGNWLSSAFPQLTWSPYLHILVYHAAEFCREWNGIGRAGEEGGEHLHAKMNRYSQCSFSSSQSYEVQAVQRCHLSNIPCVVAATARHAPKPRKQRCKSSVHHKPGTRSCAVG